MRELHASVAVFNSALVRALTESAAAEGNRLIDDPALVHVVLSGLKGLSDTIVINVAKEITPEHFVNFSAWRCAVHHAVTDRHLTNERDERWPPELP
ncbi:hypothetical protein GCM10020255_061910 [Rhodococcus baikonurensis]